MVQWSFSRQPDTPYYIQNLDERGMAVSDSFGMGISGDHIMAGFAVDVMMVHTEAGRSRTGTQRHCTTGGMMTESL